MLKAVKASKINPQSESFSLGASTFNPNRAFQPLYIAESFPPKKSTPAESVFSELCSSSIKCEQGTKPGISLNGQGLFHLNCKGHSHWKTCLLVTLGNFWRVPVPAPGATEARAWSVIPGPSIHWDLLRTNQRSHIFIANTSSKREREFTKNYKI